MWILVPAPVLIFPASASAARSRPTVTWAMREADPQEALEACELLLIERLLF